jgi:hypothetical protein
MDNSEDWAKIKMVIARRTERKTESRRQMVLMRRKEMLDHWDAKKVETMINKRLKTGAFEKSSEFPDDHEENGYWVMPPMHQRLSVTNSVAESMEAHASGDLDKGDAMSLLGPGGVLEAEAFPNVSTESLDGQRFLMQQLSCLQDVAGGGSHGGGRGSGRNTKRGRGKGGRGDGDEEIPPPEPHQPATPEEVAAQRMSEVLKSANEARSYSLSLEGFELSTDLVKQLDNFDTFMQAAYRKIQKLSQEKNQTHEIYETLYNEIDEKNKWFDVRRRVAKGMETAMRPSAPKKAAKKGNKDKEES